jgi:hypothetical protein
MVPFQEYMFAHFAARDQSIDRLARTISTIDVVAKKYENCPGRWTANQVRIDRAQKFIEEVEPPMDVPDRVDPYPSRQRRAAPLHHELLGTRQGDSHT